MTLILVAFGIAVQSIREILVPHHAPAAFTLFILIGVVIIKELMYRFLWKTGTDIKSISIKVDAWHARSDALTSLAAFIGITIALVAGKGYESADDWAALFASGVILFNGSNMWRSAINDLMDSAASPETENTYKNIAIKVPGVLDIEKCRIRKSGLNFFIEMHIVINGNVTIKKGHQIAHDVKKALLDSDPHVLDVLTHIEPHEYN
ncbi:MAG: cation diffusion facilitator family transporter, partial [Candidatus Omnitrophica bacterium]|nr:cation diffusion facilitator family transporter [Candidatus Omnitrophota bacterium]